MKNHLKRIASPKTWAINRKDLVFIARPNPGAHANEYGLALGIILRDFIKLASNMSEIKKVLNNREVLVDQRARKDHRFIAGLFDVISIPKLAKNYRITLDQKGRLTVIEIPESEKNIKVCKVVGKTKVKSGQIQYNLYDGKNILLEQQIKVGDSLVLDLPSLKVVKVIPLKVGNKVFLTKGKHGGGMGVLKEIKGKGALYEDNGISVETSINYIFVFGDKDNAMTLRNIEKK